MEMEMEEVEAEVEWEGKGREGEESEQFGNENEILIWSSINSWIKTCKGKGKGNGWEIYNIDIILL
jgi:hypothetical protein